MLIATEPEPSIEHGGALDRAERQFGRPAEGWVDLSTGINPWSWPVGPLAATVWQRLPTASDLAALLAAAADYYNVIDRGTLVAVPGSQISIQLLPRLLAPGPVAVIGPTYAEHARCWHAAGHAVTELDHLPDADAGWRYLVVVNPNNPDGRIHPAAQLLDCAARLAARGGLLVVDEAFADATPALSVAFAAGRPGLAVLRSFGKFFGLAGVRLGVVGLPPALARSLTDWLGPWAVSGPALVIGRAALTDRPWIDSTRDRLGRAASVLDRLLERHQLSVIGGTPLFRLVTTPNADAIYRACGAAGILLRRFAAQPDWLRFGLLPDPRASERLETCLQAIGGRP